MLSKPESSQHSTSLLMLARQLSGFLSSSTLNCYAGLLDYLYLDMPISPCVWSKLCSLAMTSFSATVNVELVILFNIFWSFSTNPISFNCYSVSRNLTNLSSLLNSPLLMFATMNLNKEGCLYFSSRWKSISVWMRLSRWLITGPETSPQAKPKIDIQLNTAPTKYPMLYLCTVILVWLLFS